MSGMVVSFYIFLPEAATPARCCLSLFLRSARRQRRAARPEAQAPIPTSPSPPGEALPRAARGRVVAATPPCMMSHEMGKIMAPYCYVSRVAPS